MGSEQPREVEKHAKPFARSCRWQCEASFQYACEVSLGQWNSHATAEGALSLEEAKGRTVVYARSPHVLIVTVVGQLSAAMARLELTQATALLATAPRLSIFHNWAEMTGYESAAREQLTRWTMRHKHDTRPHLLLRSPLVSMGVSVANLALGNILIVHSTLESLQAAMQMALSEPR